MPPISVERTPPPPQRLFDFRNTQLGETIGALSFDPIEAERLAKLDVTERRRELSKNLEGFKGEVLDDIPVSHLYHYYYDSSGSVYNHPDRRPVHEFETQFDPRERDGLPVIGFKKAADLMRRNPHNVALWYSPPGRATLDEDPQNPYSDVTFIYGQLYVMTFDGEKISGVAVKVDREGEDAVRQFMPDSFYKADELESDYGRIQHFLQNPVLLAGNINELTEYDWIDGIVYKGKAGGNMKRQFTVHKMLSDINNRLVNGPEEEVEIHEYIRDLSPSQLTDKRVIAQVYLTMILDHPSMQADGKMSLQGACGGSTMTQSQIEALLSGNQFEPLSSAYRLLTQSDYLEQLLKKAHAESLTRYPDYECPGCHETLSGESKEDTSSWRKECEHCGHQLNC